MQLHAKVLPLAASMVSTTYLRTPLQPLSGLAMIVSSVRHCGQSATPIRTASQAE